MTKDVFFEAIENYARRNNVNWYRLRHMSATTAGIPGYTILKSYATIVAVYDHFTEAVIVRGRYSVTTQKHVSAFADVMGARAICYCYKRYDNILVKNLWGGEDIKRPKAPKTFFYDDYWTGIPSTGEVYGITRDYLSTYMY